MNWIVDIILGIVFLITVFVGGKRGFVKSIWGLLRAVLSLAVTLMFGKILGEWLMDTFIHQRFAEIVKDSLLKIVPENNGTLDFSELFSTMPESFVDLLERFGANIEALSDKFSETVNASMGDLGVLASTIATPISRVVSEALGYVLVFVFAFLVLTLLGLVVKLISEISVLKTVNHFLGAVLGAICGLIYIWVICALLSAIIESGIAKDGSEVLKQLVANSFIFKWFCSFSPFELINIEKITDLKKILYL